MSQVMSQSAGFRLRLGIELGLGLGSPMFVFFLRLNILTHDSLIHDSFELFKSLQIQTPN